MNQKLYEFDTLIKKVPDIDFPYDVKKNLIKDELK